MQFSEKKAISITKSNMYMDARELRLLQILVQVFVILLYSNYELGSTDITQRVYPRRLQFAK